MSNIKVFTFKLKLNGLRKDLGMGEGILAEEIVEIDLDQYMVTEGEVTAEERAAMALWYKTQEFLDQLIEVVIEETTPDLELEGA
jgi:hypothetical protein